jgi:hypothetical protein
MSDELLNYPRGTVATGNGDLTQVTNLKGKYSNGAKLKHSLRKSPSGYTLGVKECSGSFDLEIPESGEERDYWSLVKDGTVKRLRIKIPGTTKAINIVVSDLDFELPSDDAIKETVSFIGELVDS